MKKVKVKVRKAKLVIENKYGMNDIDDDNSTNTKKLVIVESPSKCKKIEEYLGLGYKVIASFGHIRELNSLKNIDIKNDFKPSFELINDDDKKKKNIEIMRECIKNTTEVILATDDDREGEAIAWHICMVFNLPIETTKRIVFHEITKLAIEESIKVPRIINMGLVNSQQARQVLDLLVGFTISPLLWKYVSKNSENSLSAGRCQTPALKLVYDNQMEINKSPGKKVYNTSGYFTSKNIVFELNKKYETSDEIITFLEESVNHDHIYSYSNPTIIIKDPPKPLTTSRIQQMASNIMHISPKETMKICQMLYEEGYITYMRTDSSNYSNEFIESTTKYIISLYNNSLYVNPNINLLKLNLNNGAHEAIRPTNILTQNISDKCSLKEKKMYNIIWENTLESCMSCAEYFSITSNISAPLNNKYFYTNETVKFLGWKIIKSDNEKNTNTDYSFLQSLKQNIIINYKKITSIMTLINTKSHYTEARLVQLLEEKGIGRPSTFSMLIDKIQQRDYVKKQDIPGIKSDCLDYELEEDTITENKIIREFGNEKGKLVISQVGIIVMDFLENNFQSIFDYEYTKGMENELDKICNGENSLKNICLDCNKNIEELCIKLKEESTIKKHEIKIDEFNTYMIGKYGPVIKNISKDATTGKDFVVFKSVNKDIDIHRLENGEYKLNDIISIESNKITSICVGKHEGYDLMVRKGKYGLYMTWGKSKKSLSYLGNRPLENIKITDLKF